MWCTKQKADGVVTCEEIENKFYFSQEICGLYAIILKMSIFWLKTSAKEVPAKWLPASFGIHCLLSLSHTFLKVQQEVHRLGLSRGLTKPTQWWSFILSLFLLKNWSCEPLCVPKGEIPMALCGTVAVLNPLLVKVILELGVAELPDSMGLEV